MKKYQNLSFPLLAVLLALTCASTSTKNHEKIFLLDVTGYISNVVCIKTNILCAQSGSAICTTSSGTPLYGLNQGGTTCNIMLFKNNN